MEGPLLHAKFRPHRSNDNGIGSLKLKALLKFDQTSEYKRPAWVYQLRDFREIYTVGTYIDKLCEISRKVTCFNFVG